MAGRVHTNGVEIFCPMLKRVHTGAFHKISPKHLQRSPDEFAGRHNVREMDTMEQMEAVAAHIVGRSRARAPEVPPFCRKRDVPLRRAKGRLA